MLTASGASGNEADGGMGNDLTAGDSVELYKRFCEEENCKPNSAFIRYLQDRGSTLKLEKLSFCSNYLGPKGLIPIIRLIDKCQTLITIDLENNGADNSTVEVLCEVLERHLGITWVNLRGNPITQKGGRRLLQMVEANERITYIDVSATDIYEAVQQAIYATVERHRETVRNRTDLTPSDAVTKQYAQKVIENLPPLQKKKEPLTIVPVALPNQNGPAASPAHHTASGISLPRAALPKTQVNSTCTGNRFLQVEEEEDDEEQCGLRHGARSSKRMPAEQLRKLKAKFTERARLYQELQRSDINKTANQVRVELMTLERNFSVLPPIHKSSPKALHKEDQTVAAIEASKEQQEAEAMELEHQGEGQAAPEGETAGSTPQPPAPPPVEGATDVEVTEAPDMRPELQDALHPSKRLFMSSEEQFQSLFDQGCREYQHRQLDQAYIAWNEAMSIAVAHKNREWIAVLTTNLQHLTYEIFVKDGKTKLESGLLEDADRCFERALQIATKAKNANWQSEMVRARQSVKCAVFYKCHKAALVMLSDAKAVEDRQVTDGDYYIIPGSPGEEPDSESVDGSSRDSSRGTRIQHSQAFVNEWPRIRLVWEAVGMWVDAAKVAKKVGSAAQGGLLDVLNDALNAVSVYLIQLHFDRTEPISSVSWEGCSRFTYHECVKLSELYVDMVGYHQQHLHHDLFSCVVDLHIGNLALATYQLPLAHQKFSSALRSAKKMNVGILEAAALTYSATVNMQRANYAMAERELLEARLHWENVMKQDAEEAQAAAAAAATCPPPSPGGAAGKDANVSHSTMQELSGIAAAIRGSSQSPGQDGAQEMSPVVSLSHGNTGGGLVPASLLPSPILSRRYKNPQEAVASAIPSRYASLMANAGNKQLVTILSSTYRYQEALEMLEYGLVHRYQDLLFNKMQVNFSERPTLGQLVGVAGALRSNLVYYFVSHRHSWSVDLERYNVEESVLMWVVPRVGDMRYVELSVSKEHKTSVDALVHLARAGMMVDPPNGCETDAVVLSTHRKAWITPLERLHAIFLDPIVSYIRSLELPFDPEHSVITIIPTGSLWTVPFNALINREGRYAVEDYGIQLAFCATQAHFSTVSAERVRERNLQRSVIVRQMEIPAVEEGSENATPALSARAAAPAGRHIEPCDYIRSSMEADTILGVMRDERAARLTAQLHSGESNSSVAGMGVGAGAFVTPSEEILEDIIATKAAMPCARTVHLAVGTSYGSPRVESDGSVGEVHLAMFPTEETPAYMTALSASDMSHMELFAEVVSLSDTNIGVDEKGLLVEDALGLSRALLSAGTPCVVLGQWCTPDMYPVSVFSHFYKFLCQHAANSVSHATIGGHHGGIHKCGAGASCSSGVGQQRSSSPEEGSNFHNGSNAEGGSPGGSPGLNHNTSWEEIHNTFIAGNGEGNAASNSAFEANNLNANTTSGSVAGTRRQPPLPVPVPPPRDSERHKANYLAEALRELIKDPAMRYCPRAWAGYYCIGSGFF